MSKLLSFLLTTILLGACTTDKSEMYANDHNLFDDTPAENLAFYVAWNMKWQVERILQEDSSLVNVTEPIFGQNILQLALHYDKEDMIKLLLKYGGDPNHCIDSIRNDGGNSVLYAAFFSDDKILNCLLEAGGDPNSYLKGVHLTPEGDICPEVEDALSLACSSSAEDGCYNKVKLLLDYGAMQDPNSPHYFALKNAIIHGNMDALCLLLERGAPYDMKFVWHWLDKEENEDLDTLNICEVMRLAIIDPKDKQYQYKMKAVEWLKARGFDYWTTPIPAEIIIDRIKRRYPNNWEEIVRIY